MNGRAVPVATLQRIGRLLLDVHGQGDHLTLLRVSEHLRLLDGYAGLEERRAQAQLLAEEILRLRTERLALLQDQREIARRLDLLRFQLEEIDAARLTDGEEEELRQEHLIVANAERLTSGIDEIRELVSDAEGSSVVDRLGRATARLSELGRIDPTLADQLQVLELVVEQLSDFTRQLRLYREQVEFDPSRLTEIEERLTLIRNLQRKYGSTIADILAFAIEARSELAGLEHNEERVEELAIEEKKARAQFVEIAVALSEARQFAAQRLARAIESELAELNMAGAHFDVVLTQEPDPNGLELPDGRTVAFGVTGIDKVEFFIATNAGEDVKPLVRVVSGGETARLMLALKNILSRADAVPTIIFDEVDAGIGGQTAVIVGQKIANLARERQVICVTHLSQIAAFADTHIAVRKKTVDGRTYTEVHALDHEARVEELASMIGGAAGMSSAHAHARDALRSSGQWKAERALAEGGTR